MVANTEQKSEGELGGRERQKNATASPAAALYTGTSRQSHACNQRIREKVATSPNSFFCEVRPIQEFLREISVPTSFTIVGLKMPTMRDAIRISVSGVR